MRRRAFLALALAAPGLARAFDAVAPGVPLAFPRDRGSHPGHRIEWWYVTGEVEGPRGPLGFQATFFRVRNKAAEANASRFSPRQLLFAHAAVADPGRGRLLHDQRAARFLGDLVRAREGETDVRLDDWSLTRVGAGYQARIPADGFALELDLAPTQAPLLQGESGFSRKGPLPSQASYYYSEPQLEATGRIVIGEAALPVRGRAWLDHEWSSELLAPEANGWDWLGANLDDGGALTIFRVRAKDGSTIWATATRRTRAGVVTSQPANTIAFAPGRTWTSPRTGVAYPVEMEVTVGTERWNIRPLMDDQELDARSSTGTLYWEGAVRVESASGARGRGYLELTGYSERVPF